MADQLSPSPDSNTDTIAQTPLEAPQTARGILGDNLPTQKKAQRSTKPPVASLVNENASVRNPAANDNVQRPEEVVQTGRIFLKLIFGGSTCSLQANMLESRRQRLGNSSDHKETPEEEMLRRSRDAIGNPDKNNPAAKKVA